LSQYKEVVNNNKNINLINLNETKVNSVIRIQGVYQKIIEKKEKKQYRKLKAYDIVFIVISNVKNV
jgi:predicted GNAT family acetyltransferase